MILYDIVRDEAGELAELKIVARPQNETVESPPVDALLRGFGRGIPGAD